jgi:hypothetical protein
MKKIFTVVFGVYLLLAYVNIVKADNSCVLSGSAITGNSSTVFVNIATGYEDSCWTQPIDQIVTFHKAYACTSFPDAGETNAAAWAASDAALDISGCTLVFTSDSAAGSSVNIAEGAAKEVSGTVTVPAAGTYPYLFFLVDPNFTISGSVEFDVAFSGSVASPGNGVYCWSEATTASAVYSESTATYDMMDCSTTAPATSDIATNTIFVNGLSAAIGGVYERLFQDFTSLNGDTLTGYLLEGDLTPATSVDDDAGTITYIGIASDQSITVTDATTGFDVQYYNTGGTNMSVSNVAGTLTADAFLPGPFSIYVTPQ